MGRKRKSESISKDDEIDFVDLSVAYGVDEDPPSIPEPPASGNNRTASPFSDHKKIRNNDSCRHSNFNFANVMGQATRALDESARSMQIHSQQFSTKFDQGCTPCKYAKLDCDLQRPICERCQKLRIEGNMLTCLYTQDLHKQAKRSYAEGSALPKRSDHAGVEVIDLGSDSDKDASGNGEEYEVEAIVARRSSKKMGLQYMVKWKGYSHEANTWEPVSNLNGAQSLINKYEAAVASTLPSNHKKDRKRGKNHSPRELLRSPSLGLVVVPRNPNVLEHQTCRPIPEVVQSIDACRLVPDDDTYEYLVSWKGLAPSQSSWEAEKRFTGCKKLIQDYHLATCMNFPSDNVAVTTDHSDTDRKLISAGSQVIVCSRRTGLGSRLTYCLYDKEQDSHSWIHASELVSDEAQTAILLFVMRSTIMQGYLEPHRALALNTALNRHGIAGPAPEKKASSSIAANGQQSNAQETGMTGRTPFFRCCVECKKEGADCGGTTRCERCVTMNLICVYAHPPTYEREAAEVRLINQLSQQHSRDSPETIGTSQPITARRVPPPSASTTSNLVWKAPINFRIHGKHTPGKSSASNAASHTCTSNSPLAVVNEFYLTASGAASDKTGNKLRQVHEPTESPRQPNPWEVHNLTYADEKWINERISRTVATISEEEKIRIRRQFAMDGSDTQASANQKPDPLFRFLRSVAEKELQTWKAGNRGLVSQISNEKAREPSYAKKQKGQSNADVAHSSIRPPDMLKQSYNHERIESSSEGRKDRHYEGLKDAFDSPRRSYPAGDSYLLVRKTDKWSRPLPHGHRNYHNVASNVLLAIGRHPWLPGLNHHLRGLLDRGAGGRKINTVSAQARNAENFKGHKAPTSMSEMTEANFRATLPMGGKSF